MTASAHLVFGRLARVKGDPLAVEQQLRRAAPRLHGRDLGRRTVVLPLAGGECVIGVSFAVASQRGLPFSSMDLDEERRRARALDLPSLVDARFDIELTDREGWLCVLQGAPRAFLYLVAGLPSHLPRPLGFEELRRGELHWVGRRIATLTAEQPLLWLDPLRRDVEATVLRTFHPEAAVRDLVTLETLGGLAQRAAEAHA
jgi:hypothetical protein